VTGTAALEPVVEHVRANAGRYLGVEVAPGDVDVAVVPVGRRVRARLHRVELSAAGHRLRMMLKETSLPDAPEALTGGDDRPRLTVVEDTHERHRWEYFGLRATEERFGAMRDPRFTVVRAIDHLPAQRSFLMEDVQYPTLRDLLAGPARLTPSGRRRIATATANAGAWLREFHALPAGDADATPLRMRAAEVEAALHEQAEFAARHGGGRAIQRAMAEAVAAIADGALPDPLPLGLWHLDFAPRNVFVTPTGAVAGFDMAARRRAPIYEDLAFFVMNLRRARSRGAHRFLAGYFGTEPIPERALAVFNLLVSLDERNRRTTENA
jgi:hypothetical protein